jgi:hypothetical protein
MSFTIGTGDVADFVAAQDSLRAQLGAEVTFGVPTDPQWPEGTAINADTGVPFDATVVQSNAEFDYTTITCLVIEKQGSPLRPQADTYFNQSGFRSGMDIILDVATADYEATVANATTFTVDGDDFSVEEAKPFSIGTTIYRYIVYGAAK